MKNILFFLIFTIMFSSCSTALYVNNSSDFLAVVNNEKRNGRFYGGIILSFPRGLKTTSKIDIFDHVLSHLLNSVNSEIITILPADARVTVVSITAPSQMQGADGFLIDELTSLLVNKKKYIVVDRRNLDAIRFERYFQMSGDVDDNTAISIGQMLGADIIITGALRMQDDNLSLSIKALNVETAQILAMASSTAEINRGLRR